MKIRNANIEIRDKSKIQITKYNKLITNYCFATEITERKTEKRGKRTEKRHNDSTTKTRMEIRNANIEIRDKSKIQIAKYYKLITNYCFATEVLYKHINSTVLQAAEKLPLTRLLDWIY